MPHTARSVRRLIAGDDASGKAVVLKDGLSPDVHDDPARPGFYATRLWVTEETPARVRGITETLHLPHRLEAPTNGSVFRMIEIPPDAGFLGKVDERAVRHYFDSMGSPQACAWSANAAHPYMQRTGNLDYCVVLSGEATLVADDGAATLRSGDTAIIRGTRHAWANRSAAPALVWVCSHDAINAGGGVLSEAIAPLPAPPAGVRKTVRRVVTGTHPDGRSRIIYDAPAPSAKLRPGSQGTYYTEVWTERQIPADLSGNRDDDWFNEPVEHSPPPLGARLRLPVSGAGGASAPVTDPAEVERAFNSMNKSGMSERRHGHHHWHMHRSRTVDYAMALSGDRHLVLDDDVEVLIKEGDVVIQLGNYHAWEPIPGQPGQMAFDMIGATYE